MTINIDDFKKVEIKVGKILSAEKIASTDKLLVLKVHFGNKVECIPKPEEMKSEINECSDIRQVVSGIAESFPEPEQLAGLKCLFVTNLETRKIKDVESQAMILAAGVGSKFSLFVSTQDVEEGSIVK